MVGLVVGVVVMAAVAGFVYTTDNGQITSLQSVNSQDQVQNTQLRSNISALNSNVSSLEAQKASLNTQITNLNSNVSSLENQKTALALQTVELSANISILKTQTVALNANLTNLESVRSTLQSQLQASQSNATNLENQLGSVNSQISTIQGQVSQDNNDISTDTNLLSLSTATTEVTSQYVYITSSSQCTDNSLSYVYCYQLTSFSADYAGYILLTASQISPINYLGAWTNIRFSNSVSSGTYSWEDTQAYLFEGSSDSLAIPVLPGTNTVYVYANTTVSATISVTYYS